MGFQVFLPRNLGGLRTFVIGFGKIFTKNLFLLLFSSRKSVWSPLQQISRFALQCITELIQDVGAIALATVVKECVKGWVGNVRRFGKLVSRHTFAFKNALQSADDHTHILSNAIYSTRYISHPLHS